MSPEEGGRAGPWEEEQGRWGGRGVGGQEGPSWLSSGSEVETAIQRSGFPALLRIEVTAVGRGRRQRVTKSGLGAASHSFPSCLAGPPRERVDGEAASSPPFLLCWGSLAPGEPWGPSDAAGSGKGSVTALPGRLFPFPRPSEWREEVQEHGPVCGRQAGCSAAGTAHAPSVSASTSAAQAFPRPHCSGQTLRLQDLPKAMHL